jgi:choice-of-anchor A domain-containing protein
MYRTGLTCLLAAAVIIGALNCGPSEPGPEPAPGPAKVGTAARGLAEEGCSSCLGTPLGDYNVFLLEDYTAGGDVGGKVAVGGNVHINGRFLGQELPGGDLSLALVAGGDLELLDVNLRGDARYGGNSTSRGVKWIPECPGCTVSRDTPIDFADRFDKLRCLSARLDALPANGTTEPRKYGRDLYMTGEEPGLNVFEVNASDLPVPGVGGWFIKAPADAFVVINIRGASATFPGSIGRRGSFDSRRLLFNLVDATSLTASGIYLEGTVLAPKAHVTFDAGQWSGGIYAASLSSSGLTLKYNPLEALPGSTAAECTGSETRSCTAWCGAKGTQTCDPATCGYGACVSPLCCRTDADCAGGARCEGNLCDTVVLKDNGAECGGDGECASGHCADGVCCDTACAGACDACDLAGHKGTCGLVDSTVRCRDAEGGCDAAEFCTGDSAACPADAVVEAGTACREATGSCDAAESCDGSSKACPTDELAPNGTACGTSPGEWSGCGGFSDFCASTGTQSREVTISTCAAGTCGPTSTSLETRSCTRVPPGPVTCSPGSESWGSCEEFSDACDETGTQAHTRTTYSYNCATGECEPSTVEDRVACTRITSGVPCRDTADACDAAEYCSDGTCPADGKALAGTSCDDGSSCTTADACDGAGACFGTPPSPCPAATESLGTC